MSDTDETKALPNQAEPKQPSVTKDATDDGDFSRQLAIDVTESPRIVLQPETPDALTDDFHDAYGEVKTWIMGEQNLNSIECISLTMRIMKLVEKTKRTTGEQKKALVIRILKRLVSEHTYANSSDKEQVESFVNSVLPILIDVFVSIARGRIDLGKKCRVLKRLSCG